MSDNYTVEEPDFAAMQALLALLNQGHLTEGEAAATDMIRHFPHHGFGWKLLGLFLKFQHRHGEAIRAMHRAVELLPDDSEAQCNFGMALAEANELPAAEAFIRRTLELDPDHAPTYCNLGNILSRQGRLEEALFFLRRALEINPEYVEALNNLGSTLQDLGCTAEAEECYRNALAIKPDFAQAHWNWSMIKLSSGDFIEGWKQYEWRWKADSLTMKNSPFHEAPWLGQPSLQGKAILLHAEQGLGDTIQFCRYAKLVAARGANVILRVPLVLKSLLSDLPGVADVITESDTLPPFDFHCPLLSLPLAFGTDLNSIPADVPYLFAQPSLAEMWRSRLLDERAEGVKDVKRIGIAWSGNAWHRHDYKRSIPLADLTELIAGQSQFACLQKDVNASDLVIWNSHARTFYFGDELRDFADTAALISSMDLVITVDTAVAHLCGAMGKPVWILLPFQADWRWLQDREDSPWYPSARLFRQSAMGDWPSVIREVKSALQDETS